MSGTILIGKHTLLLTILIIASTSQSTDQNYLHLIQSSHENVGVLSTVEHGTGQKMFPVVRKLLEAPEREDTKQVNSLNVRGVITGNCTNTKEIKGAFVFLCVFCLEHRWGNAPVLIILDKETTLDNYAVALVRVIRVLCSPNDKLDLSSTYTLVVPLI